MRNFGYSWLTVDVEWSNVSNGFEDRVINGPRNAILYSLDRIPESIDCYEAGSGESRNLRRGLADVEQTGILDRLILSSEALRFVWPFARHSPRRMHLGDRTRRPPRCRFFGGHAVGPENFPGPEPYLAMLQQSLSHHRQLPGLRVPSCLDTVEVDAAREPAGIEVHFMVPRILLTVLQHRYVLSESIEHCQHHM